MGKGPEWEKSKLTKMMQNGTNMARMKIKYKKDIDGSWKGTQTGAGKK